MTQFFDVTELVCLRFNSGIQRVVREVVGRAVDRPHEPAVAVIAVGKRFHRLTPEGRAAMTGQGVAATGALPSGDSRIKAVLRRVPALFMLARRASFHRRLKAMRTLYEADPVALSSGDTLVLIDTLWSGGATLDAAASARSRGARIALVVYDLFPITHSQWASREVAYYFPRMIGRALALAEGAVTISREGTRELLAHAPGLDPTRVAHAYLGHDFAPSAAAPDPLEAFPQGLWQGSGRTYLMVGTIEARKGHDYVLNAFEQLWAAGGEQTLLIIGKPGWHADALLARAAAHPRRGHHLFLIHDASDLLLRSAIERCDALVMASSLEGFGLPLVEALSAGRPVLASDIPVFREIADGAATFFRCGDADAMAEAIRRFEANPEAARDRAQAFHWSDWNEAASGFLAAIETILPPPDRGDQVAAVG